MNLETINQLICLMEQSSLSLLEVEDNGTRVRMECRRELFGEAASAPKARALPKQVEAELAPTLQEQSELTGQAPQEDEPPVGHAEIRSPMVGTFHASKNPLKVGMALKAGDPVCVIEAMKVMNEILMEEDGVISWIACEEGDMVEYGQILFTYH